MDAGNRATSPQPSVTESGWPLGVLLGVVLVTRLVQIDQPIVENYVGRQIPTAMVARNLDRGSGFLRPQLDTAPFPNYFLVEPPLYESMVVALKRATGSSLDASGRAVSALAMTAAAWGLFELIGRRGGRRAALLAVAAFAAFPLTIRYGRAFQPDAAMLGACVAGLACWDRHQARGSWFWLAAGWSLLALGLAIKVVAAFLLLPLVFGVLRPRRPLKVVAACSTIGPALLWYAWAEYLLAGSNGSRAPADNRAIWLSLPGLWSIARPETWHLVSQYLFLRAFTPLGAGLAVVGLLRPGTAGDSSLKLWRVWGGAAVVTLAVLARKLHHEYYFLMLAPVAAAGVGHALERVYGLAGATWPRAAIAGLAILGGLQSRSTWRIPSEWEGLPAAASLVASNIPAASWVVATEALLFQADRRGCRLEWTRPAIERAAGEWGADDDVRDPADLVALYRRRGARYFADLGDRGADPLRMALHNAVRRRYKVIVDRPEVIIADLVAAEVLPHAN
jgi:4-amino-4-deoxy-L-arabinose transferase-like glycosyltransferase